MRTGEYNSDPQARIHGANITNHRLFRAVLQQQLPNNPALKDKPLSALALTITKSSELRYFEGLNYIQDTLRIEPITRDSNEMPLGSTRAFIDADLHLSDPLSPHNLHFIFSRKQDDAIETSFDSLSAPQTRTTKSGLTIGDRGLRAAVAFAQNLEVHYFQPKGNDLTDLDPFTQDEVDATIHVRHFARTPLNGHEGLPWLQEHYSLLDNHITHALDNLMRFKDGDPPDHKLYPDKDTVINDLTLLSKKRTMTAGYLSPTRSRG